MVRHVLNTSNEEFDFALIGITSYENQYRLASLLSDTLGIEFFLSDYVPMNLRNGKLFRFSLYRYVSHEFRLDYFFIPNTSNFEEPQPNNKQTNDLFANVTVEESTRLVKELPKTDYFLIIKGEEPELARHRVMEKLKTINEITQLQIIEPGELSSKRNLIF